MAGEKKDGIKRTSALVEKLIRKNNKERINYLKKIKQKELNLLSEVCINIIKGNVKITKRIKTILTRVKDTLKKLSSRTAKSEINKKIWVGIRGLHILNILLPIIQNEILLSN